MVGSGRGRAMKVLSSMGSAALTGLTTASIASAAESRRDMGASSIVAQWGLYDPHAQELEYHPLHLIQAHHVPCPVIELGRPGALRLQSSQTFDTPVSKIFVCDTSVAHPEPRSEPDTPTLTYSKTYRSDRPMPTGL